MKFRTTSAVLAGALALGVAGHLNANPDIYNDATGDIGPGLATGGGTLDLVSLEITNTETDIVFSLTVNGSLNSPDWGKFMIGIAQGGAPASASYAKMPGGLLQGLEDATQEVQELVFLIVLARRFEVGEGKDHLDPLVAQARTAGDERYREARQDAAPRRQRWRRRRRGGRQLAPFSCWSVYCLAAALNSSIAALVASI
jgi:hypothetical protein